MSLETRIRSNNNQGGGGVQSNTSSVVYAPTGGPYVSYTSDVNLPSAKVITASNNITITTDSTTIWLSANTGSSGSGGASTAGNYIVFLADAGLSNEKVLTASNNITITTDGTSVFLTALTPTVIAQSGGTVYTSTGSYFALSQTDGSLPNSKVIVASNNLTVTTDSTRIFLTALTPTIVAQSGGTVYTATGSFFLLSQTDGSLSNSKVIVASNNITVTTSATQMLISANTGATIFFAPTGGEYVTWVANNTLSNEKILTASNNIQITTSATQVFVTALTPTVVAQSGGTVYTSTGSYFALSQTDSTLPNSKVIVASNNMTVTTDATRIFLTALTPTIVAQTGGTVYTATGSYFLLSQTDGTLPNSKVIVASNNITVTTSATQMLISANTGATIFFAPSNAPYITFLADSTLSNEKILTASNNITITTGASSVFITALTPTVVAQSGGTVYASTGNSYVVLSLAGDLTADRALVASTGLTLVDGGANGNATLAVNTNVRDKTYAFFAPLALSTTMAAEEIRFRIPFNCEPIRCDLALTTTPLVSGITCDLLQFTSPVASGTTIFSTSGNKPQIGANSSSGFTTTFDTTILHAGSFLGMRILQVGSATAQGSNLTLTLIVRSS